ncbi:MAG: XRE family transcriptional regulator [Clostridiales bacterium]|nr:XRE family transcriptional regulator [Clostridiales bacterium]
MEELMGKKIKELRIARNMTLKDLSNATELSISFLSQIERGITSVAIQSLGNIAKALGVELSYFFRSLERPRNVITRSWEQQIFHDDKSRFVYYSMSNNREDALVEPMIASILPTERQADIPIYSHEGEEFIYVLEGNLTVIVEDEEQVLQPGDSAHIPSVLPHELLNFTARPVRIIFVTTSGINKHLPSSYSGLAAGD